MLTCITKFTLQRGLNEELFKKRKKGITKLWKDPDSALFNSRAGRQSSVVHYYTNIGKGSTVFLSAVTTRINKQRQTNHRSPPPDGIFPCVCRDYPSNAPGEPRCPLLESTPLCPLPVILPQWKVQKSASQRFHPAPKQPSPVTRFRRRSWMFRWNHRTVGQNTRLGARRYRVGVFSSLAPRHFALMDNRRRRTC